MLSDAFRTATGSGGVDAALGARAQSALDTLARPVDLSELVGVARAGGAGLGPGGPQLAEQFDALDRRVAGAEIAPSAADLVRSVRAGVDQGELLPAVQTAALPVLEPLADAGPRDDLAAVAAQLGSETPLGRRLIGLDDLPVAERTDEARALLAAPADLPAEVRDRLVADLRVLAQR